MKSVLEHFTENAIIDELIYLSSETHRIHSVRACAPMFRRPFIEVEMANGEVHHRHFQRERFARDWSEALVILETLTGIELLSDFKFQPLRHRLALVQKVEIIREACLADADLMFNQRLYLQYLNQFGLDYKNLPELAQRRIAEAKANLKAER